MQKKLIFCSITTCLNVKFTNCQDFSQNYNATIASNLLQFLNRKKLKNCVKLFYGKSERARGKLENQKKI